MAEKQTSTIVIPTDPKRVLIPLSVVAVVLGFLAMVAWKATAAVVSWQKSIERNTEQVARLRETIESDLLERDDFDVWVKRVRDLNPEMRWPD